jgi:UDP-N-acetylglucosamine--N-acetylmuramyl-(pentapeptide) pyrophosphoryl-undecaprenol N-acetylglucosamine transferase
MRIVFTGGGSAGHVTPNLALIDQVQSLAWDIAYIGSKGGIEKNLIHAKKVPYYAIQSGKLRRQLTWKNLLTPFQVLIGIVQSYLLCRRLRPNCLFSKGGFVAFPVVVGAWLNRIPVIVHESDFSPGLANRLSYPFAQTVCLTFSETARFFKDKKKLHITGTPLRKALFCGDAERGISFCRLIKNKKVLLIIGGGLGAARINQQVRQVLPQLLKTFNVIHLCGKGKVDNSIVEEGYCQFDYIHDELPDLFAAATIVISRAGANSIYEILALEKPSILIPLGQASRGDQIHNAAYFAEKKLTYMLDETQMTNESFLKVIDEVDKNSPKIKKALQDFQAVNGVDAIVDLIKNLSKLSS